MQLISMWMVIFTVGFNNFFYPPIDISSEEANLVAMVAYNEAGCESELGKRLVIDTIFNRVDHEKFPDDISEVIFQKNQYTSKESEIRDDILKLVEEERIRRTNRKVIFFRTKKYSTFGEPLFKEGAHYFSSLEENDDK